MTTTTTTTAPTSTSTSTSTSDQGHAQAVPRTPRDIELAASPFPLGRL